MDEDFSKNEQPKKKTNGCLIALLILFIIFLLIAGGVYWGYKRIISGTAKQTDLGVSYTYQDYENVMSNAGIEVSDPSELCLDCTYPVFSDPHDIDVYVSNSGASAWVDVTNKSLSYGSISNTQIKFSDDKAEISTLFTYNGKVYPVYASGNIAKATSTSISAQLDDLKVAGVNVPSGLKSYVQTALLSVVNSKLESLGNTLNIEEIDFTSSGLHFKGLFPSKGD